MTEEDERIKSAIEGMSEDERLEWFVAKHNVTKVIFMVKQRCTDIQELQCGCIIGQQEEDDAVVVLPCDFACPTYKQILEGAHQRKLEFEFKWVDNRET